MSEQAAGFSRLSVQERLDALEARDNVLEARVNVLEERLLHGDAKPYPEGETPGGYATLCQLWLSMLQSAMRPCALAGIARVAERLESFRKVIPDQPGVEAGSAGSA